MCLAALTMLTACSASGGFDWSQLESSTGTENAAVSPEEQTLLRDSLTLYMPSASGAFDPLTNPSAQMQELFSLVFEGLLRVDEQGRLEPWLAETMERTENGWRFRLRSGIKFHDGTLLSAQDIVNAFTRLQEAGEEGAYAYCLKQITSMSVEDNSTLLAETANGYESLYALCFPIGRYPESSGLPKGTGPYRVDSYLAGTELKLERNENWWRRPAQIASLRAIAREGEPTAELVQAGELDAALTEMTMTSALYGHSRVGTQDYLTGCVDLLLPNLRGQLADETLRRAILGILDRKDLIANAYQSHGVAVEVPVWPDSFVFEQVEIAAQDLEGSWKLLESIGWQDLDGDGLLEKKEIPVPEETPDVDLEPSAEETPAPSPTPVPTPTRTPRPTPSDEVTVEKLLGLEDGQKEAEPERLSLRLAVSDNGTGTALDIAARLRSQFLSAGITLQVENLSMEEMGKRLQDGDFDLAMIGYQLGNSADLRPLLHSEGENNVMGYKSDAMDAALDALLAADSAERYQLAAQRVYAQIQRDLPIYTLIMRTKTRVTAPGLLAPGTGRQGQSYRGIENWSFDTDN